AVVLKRRIQRLKLGRLLRGSATETSRTTGTRARSAATAGTGTHAHATKRAGRQLLRGLLRVKHLLDARLKNRPFLGVGAELLTQAFQLTLAEVAHGTTLATGRRALALS